MVGEGGQETEGGQTLLLLLSGEEEREVLLHQVWAGAPERAQPLHGRPPQTGRCTRGGREGGREEDSLGEEEGRGGSEQVYSTYVHVYRVARGFAGLYLHEW